MDKIMKLTYFNPSFNHLLVAFAYISGRDEKYI